MRSSVLFPVIFLVMIIFIPAVSAHYLKVTDPTVMVKVMERNAQIHEVPFIAINPVAIRHREEKFTVTARTNLGVDTEVNYMIYPTAMLSRKSIYSLPVTPNGTVKVLFGNGYTNKITIDVDTSTYRAGEYEIDLEIYSNKNSPFDDIYFKVN